MNDSAHTCPQGWDLTQLLAYVDGELPDAARAQVDEHVKVCPFCAEELESLRLMHALLAEHPDAFHPDEEELYRFVSQGEDPGSEIASHLEGCEACSHDAELLKEMISQPAALVQDLPAMPPSLRAKLGRADIPPTPGPFARLLSSIRDLLSLPFRMPVLALGSAAAVLIIVVVCLPLWRSHQMEQWVKEFRASETKRLAGKMERQRHLEELSREGDRLEADRSKEPAKQAYSKADQAMPAAPPSKPTASAPAAPVPEPGLNVENSKEQALPSAHDAASRLKPSPAAPAAEPEAGTGSAHPAPGAVPAQSPLGRHHEAELQEAPTPEAKRPELGMSRPQPRSHALYRKVKKDKTRRGEEPSKGGAERIPVAVDVTDGQGRPVPWIHISLPQGLEHRFILVSSRYNEKAEHRAKFRVEIRVYTAEGAYDVVCRLFDVPSGRELAYVTATPKHRKQVPGAVILALQRLLEHQ